MPRENASVSVIKKQEQMRSAQQSTAGRVYSQWGPGVGVSALQHPLLLLHRNDLDEKISDFSYFSL